MLWEITAVLRSHHSSPGLISAIFITLSCEIQLSCHIFTELTSFSIHGLPRQVAKQPNSPKMMMMAPVPIKTYGALVPLSEFSSSSNSKLTFPHTPTASRITPVNYKHLLSDIFCKAEITRLQDAHPNFWWHLCEPSYYTSAEKLWELELNKVLKTKILFYIGSWMGVKTDPFKHCFKWLEYSV